MLPHGSALAAKQTVPSGLTGLKPETVSRFGFVRNGSFHTRRSLVLSHSLDTLKPKFSSTFFKRWWCPETTPLDSFCRKQMIFEAAKSTLYSLHSYHLQYQKEGV